MKYPRVHLWRRPMVAGQPTQGSFMLESAPNVFRHLFVKCLELPWFNNDKGRSCIPPGGPGEEATYKLLYTFSPKYGRKMWLVGWLERNGRLCGIIRHWRMAQWRRQVHQGQKIAGHQPSNAIYGRIGATW